MSSQSRRGGGRIADFRVTDDNGDRLRVHTREPMGAGPVHVAVGLARLCDAAVAELGVSGASVTLMTPRGAVALAAAHGRRDRGFEELQFDLGEGPGRDAYSAGRPVLVPDVRASLAQWPGLASGAAEDGVLAAFAFPLQFGAARFGAITFIDDVPRRLTGQEVNACLIFAEVATELLLDSSPNGDPIHPDLQAAAHKRTAIYQAQGMVTVDLAIGLTEALARMRATAFAEGVPLHELSLEIIDGRRLAPADDLPPGPRGDGTTEPQSGT